NLGYNVALAVIIVLVFRERQRPGASVVPPEPQRARVPGPPLRLVQMCTIAALLAVAVAALVYGVSIGFVALAAAAALQAAFRAASAGAEKRIAWSVVLLVCGVVTYVAALQRYGTVDAVGHAIAGLGTPLVVALLICAVGAVTSAF